MISNPTLLNLSKMTTSWGALAALSLSLLVSVFLRQSSSLNFPEPVQGRNDTVLFLTTANHGQVNVHLATVQALLESYPSVTVHFASAQSVAQSLDRVSSPLPPQRVGPSNTSLNLVFHELPGLEPMEVMMRRQFGPDVMRHFRHPPGAKGAGQLNKIAQASLSPWTCDEFVRIYDETLRVIAEVDPAVVVLDFAFRPAIDATRKANRRHIFLTPTSLVDMLPLIRPDISVLWKYPIVGTDFPYPIAWRNIPENIYVALRAIFSFETMADLVDTKKCIRAHGIDNAFGSLSDGGGATSWIMPTMPEASTPVDPIPDNVHCTGPIALSIRPAMEQDPALVEWLQGAPTVLICLGSLFQYDQERTALMAQAIRILLDQTPVQVLWKFGQADWMDQAKLHLQEYVDRGRVQIHRWLTVNPVSLLETGVAHNAVGKRFEPGAQAEDDMLGSFIKHGLTRKECEAEGLFMVLAGSETTARFAREPFLVPSTYEEARKIPYLQAVLYEGLRMRPPAPSMFPKAVPKGGDTISGMFVPEGTAIGANTPAMMRSPEEFGPDPDVFRPERFTEADAESRTKMERTVDLLFGHGRWMCVGKPVAMMELNKVYFELLRAFDFQLAYPMKPWDSESYTIFMEQNFWVRVTESDEPEFE